MNIIDYFERNYRQLLSAVMMIKEVDRLQYEVQHRPKKKDNVNTGV